MLETPTQLKEVAITHFNESLCLMQAGRYEEALEELENAEKAAKGAKADCFFLYFRIIKGQLMRSIGEYERSLRPHALSLKSTERALSKEPENELYQSILHINRDAIKSWESLL